MRSLIVTALVIVVAGCAPQIACKDDRNCPDELPACVEGLCAQPIDDDDDDAAEGEGDAANDGEGEAAEGEGEGDPFEADVVCGVRVPRGVDPDHVVGGDDDEFAGCHRDLDGAFASFVEGDGAIYVAAGRYVVDRVVPDGAVIVGDVAHRGAGVVVEGAVVVDSAVFRGVSFASVDVSAAVDVEFDRCAFDDDALVAVAFAGAFNASDCGFGAVDLDVERGTVNVSGADVDGEFHVSGFSSNRMVLERLSFSGPGLTIDADVDIDLLDSTFAPVGDGVGGALRHTGATLKVRGTRFTGFHGQLLDGRPVGAVRVVDGPLSTGRSRINLGEHNDDGGNVFTGNDTDLSIETPYVPFEVQAGGNTWSREPICDGAILRLADEDSVTIGIGNSSFCILPL